MSFKSERYKIFFFDFDGVIKDSNDIKGRAFQQLFGDGVSSDLLEKIYDFHVNHGGISRADKIKIFLEWQQIKASADAIQNYCEKFSELVVENVINSDYVDGVTEFISRVSDIGRAFVISATPQQEIIHICERLKLDKYFSGIYGWPVAKEMAIKNVLLEHNAAPEECVFFGDSDADRRASNQTKVDFVFRSTNTDSRKNSGDLAVIGSFYELRAG